MSVERFLQFWSRYNAGIIEVLIALILFTVVYLAFRTFFGKGGLAEEAEAPAGLNVGELEKTLQKLVEQSATRSGAAPGAEASAPGSLPASGGGAEVEQLKAQLAEKEKALIDLQNKPATTSGVPPEEKQKLEEKVKDLEARLAEYEIISEDIADLSFYKEENAKLQKELEALRASGASPTPAVDALDSAPVTADPLAAAAAPVPEPALEPVLEPMAEAAPAPSAEPALDPFAPPPDLAAAPTEPAAETAVEEPKPAEAAVPAADAKPEPTAEEALRDMANAASEKPAPAIDESQLMNQFEDFVKKG